MNDRTNGAPRPEAGPDPEPVAGAKTGGTRAQERIAALDPSAATAATAASLQEQLQATVQRAEEAEAGWQRARADFANLKRRVEEERGDLAAAAAERLLGRILGLADDLDLAIEHVPDDIRGSAWVEGIDAIDRKLRAILDAEGVTAMGSEGEPFDPRTQQAVSYEDHADMADGTVVKVLQRGYEIRGRVLRPALVAVARNVNDATASTAADD
jgi:molecular chaperone GrpE